MTDFNLVLSQVRQRLEILYQIVDELEAQGGGGGQGGTDNYNELTNKPKINNVTLSGNKTGEDLGLADYAALADKADKSTTYTKTQVDGLLDDKADKSTTYTKTEVDTALNGKADAATTYTKTETDAEIASGIVGAINDLDVTAVGGSTKYLTTISEANGLIDATAASPDTVPTTSSTKLITSGGVKTYVDNQVATKASINDIYGPGIEIPDGADLNNDVYKVPGVYYRKSTSTSEYVTNTPVTSNYFKIIVEWVYPDYRLRQTFISLSRNCTYYMRVYDSGGWQAWNTFKSSEQNIFDVFGQGVRIQGTDDVHEDLDNYWTAGNYYILTSGDAGNTDNKPYDPNFDVASVRARVLVFQFSGTTATDARCFQIYVPARANNSTGSNVMYIRYRYISSGTPGWTAWSAIGGTALGPAPTLNMVSGEMRTAVEPEENEEDDER